jgi:hypothetical protein
MSLQEASISALTRKAGRRVRSATFSHGVIPDHAAIPTPANAWSCAA